MAQTKDSQVDFEGMMQNYLRGMIGGGGGASSILKSNPYTMAATMGLGVVQAAIGFSKRNNKVPKYGLTAGMENSISEADAMRDKGFTSGEMAAGENRLQKGQATGFQKAVDVAPGLVSAVQAGINYVNQDAQYRIMEGDAVMRRSNVRYSDSLRREKQRVTDMNTREPINQHNDEQQQYGMAAQTGLNNAIYGMTELSDNWANEDSGDDNSGDDNSKLPIGGEKRSKRKTDRKMKRLQKNKIANFNNRGNGIDELGPNGYSEF